MTSMASTCSPASVLWDRAVFPPLMHYWVPGVEVSGLHELVANALVMDGEKERTENLRGEPLTSEEDEADV